MPKAFAWGPGEAKWYSCLSHLCSKIHCTDCFTTFATPPTKR